MPARPFRYEEDLSGVNPNNLVPNEEHVLQAVGSRFLVTKRGPYFTESVVVTDKATGRVLAPHLDYKCVQLEEEPTLLSGKEVCSVVVIITEDVGSAVLITYQAFGGWLSYSVTAIIEMIEALQLDERTVYWGQLVGVPDRLPPAPHRHPLSDVVGWHKLFPGLAGIRDAIYAGNQPVIDALRESFAAQLVLLTNRYDAQMAQVVDHINATGNVHGLNIHDIDGLTATEIQGELNKYLLKTGTAVNSNKVYDKDLNELIDTVNRNLNNSLLSTGIMPIKNLANGMRTQADNVTPVAGQVITEQGWMRFKDLLDTYLDSSTTTGMYYVGATSVADIQLAFANETTYPSPILVGFENTVATLVYYGNGAVYQYSYDRGLIMKFAPGQWARVSSW